jgi:O-antigen ligase
VVLGGAALVVSALSFRRAVWIGAAVVLLVMPLAHRTIRLAVRPVVALIAVGALALVAVPSVATAVSDRASSFTGASSTGHVNDLRIGYQAARHVPMRGLGAAAQQLPGLASSKTNALYVHDDYLQAWLRFGLIGVLLMLAFVVVAVREAWPALRATDEPVVCGAAITIVMLPVVMIAFPVMSTTLRWPALAGLATGLLVERRRQRENDVALPAALVPA